MRIVTFDTPKTTWRYRLRCSLRPRRLWRRLVCLFHGHDLGVQSTMGALFPDSFEDDGEGSIMLRVHCSRCRRKLLFIALDHDAAGHAQERKPNQFQSDMLEIGRELEAAKA